MRKLPQTALLLSGVLALGACTTAPTPTPAPQTTTIQGNVFTSGGSGGALVQGARVTATFGGVTKSAVTGIDGRFVLDLTTAESDTDFDLTVEPPMATSLVATTYDDVPLEAYRSEYGAANELNLYLSNRSASLALPANIATPRLGCISGTVTDGGQPVVSNAAESRAIYTDAACKTLLANVPGFIASQSTPAEIGETGLVLRSGLVTIRTNGANEYGGAGSYVLPVQTSDNHFAVSINMWAGNYDGANNANPDLATAYFWSKFDFKPRVDAYTSNATQGGVNFALQDFDPATNSKVTTLDISYDASRLTAPQDGGILFETIPSFTSAIFAGGIEQGKYYPTTPQETSSMRVYKLDPSAEAQSIEVSSTAYRVDSKFNLKGYADFTGYRNGTNLSTPLKATYLSLPQPQSPALEAKDVSRKPTLSWQAVQDAKVYFVSLFEIVNGAAVATWSGSTPNTSLTVPFELKAGTTYRWSVSTDDTYEMVDYIGSDPGVVEASKWVDLSRSAKYRHVTTDAVNEWRGELARAYIAARGSVPTRPTREAAGQRLQVTGIRSVVSENFTFTTGN